MLALPAPFLLVLSSLLFATMGLCVKLASAHYGTGEIVFYRGLTGAVMLAVLAWRQGGSLRTPVPGMHLWRSLSGVAALCLWFYALGGLPLATAVTLNYMSSVWMALFLMGSTLAMGRGRVDGRLVLTVLTGFGGVALVLQPTVGGGDQLWQAVSGLLSGMLAAAAYLQVTALGRAGEPEYRTVFYFSLGGMGVGGLLMGMQGMHEHTWQGMALLLSVGLLATTAQLLMTRAYATGKPLVNASLQYLGIVFSFLYGVLLFDDAVTWTALAGMGLIVAAGLAATLLRSRSAVSPSRPLPLSTESCRCIR